MPTADEPPGTVLVTVPVRVCDVGGWTDTWFAGSGAVCSLAAGPGVSVTARRLPAEPGAPPYLLAADGLTAPYGFDPEEGVHGPLTVVEAAAVAQGQPTSGRLKLRVRSAVPAGAGTGTSAAVAVASVAALRAAAGLPVDPSDVAAAAHRLETDVLGLQSGVQDQQAAALGGALLLEIPAYPTVRARPLNLVEGTARELRRRLVTVFLGRAHVSSEVHEQVIAARDGRTAGVLADLRSLAARSAEALEAADLVAYGHVLCAATDAQARLHPTLVGDDARALIDAARAAGAAGWKVNGAGGDGGTVTLLAGPGPDAAFELRRAVARLGARYRVLDLEPVAGGLAVVAD